MPNLLNRFKFSLSEFIASFFLVLLGTGAIIVHEEKVWEIGNFGIALSFGLIVCVMILCVGRYSGAHMNPAVSIALYLHRALTFQNLIIYLAAQIAGACTASFVLRQLFPSNISLGATLPYAGIWPAFGIEVLMTFLLILLVLSLKKLPFWIKNYAPYWIGFLIFLEAYFGGPISGASMNPARSIGPALVSGAITDLWIYILAPLAGTVLAVFFVRLRDEL